MRSFTIPTRFPGGNTQLFYISHAMPLCLENTPAGAHPGFFNMAGTWSFSAFLHIQNTSRLHLPSNVVAARTVPSLLQKFHLSHLLVHHNGTYKLRLPVFLAVILDSALFSSGCCLTWMQLRLRSPNPTTIAWAMHLGYQLLPCAVPTSGLCATPCGSPSCSHLLCTTLHVWGLYSR